MAQSGIVETMRASKKEELLCGQRYDFAETLEVFARVLDGLGHREEIRGAGFVPEEPIDLSRYYFAGPSPAHDRLQRVDEAGGIASGLCVGMIGSSIVFEQAGALFVVPLKDWESHEVELVEGAVLREYDFKPQQLSLL